MKWAETNDFSIKISDFQSVFRVFRRFSFKTQIFRKKRSISTLSNLSHAHNKVGGAKRFQLQNFRFFSLKNSNFQKRGGASNRIFEHSKISKTANFSANSAIEKTRLKRVRIMEFQMGFAR